ncbi:MAG TPA: energy-coupling factor transporter transmembrane component T [Gaiellaceae bacterium]|nr:energy-coupling factor transporter transmembrane component T [Gaiellaceae bacterium]
MSPVPAAVLLAGLAAAALLADRTISVAIIAAALFAACLRAPRPRRWPYLVGTIASGVVLLLFSPLAARYGGVVYWEGPEVPVVGQLDVTSEELSEAVFQALRLVAVGLAFAAYALLLDHDRLLLAGGRLRRSVLAVGLATRLLPALERDAAGYVEALRGRGVAVEGLRGRARLLSPLVAGSLERSLNLAESMEARGFGRPGRTRAPSPSWGSLDRLALAGAGVVVLAGVLWL